MRFILLLTIVSLVIIWWLPKHLSGQEIYVT